LQVSDIAEIYHLSRLPDLQVLSLTENPIATEPDYRQKVLAYLPNLQRLDDMLVTPDEVEEAQAR
jgi:cilla- and flagella-associated protein